MASPPGLDLSQGPHGPIGVLVCGHGSRNRLAVAEFAQLARGLQAQLPAVPVQYGYLEFARPILRDGLDALRAKGVGQVLAVPAMLFAAGHAKNDIPSVLNTYAASTGVEINYGRELGVDLKMIQAAAARIREAIATADATEPTPIEDTLLVVVGGRHSVLVTSSRDTQLLAMDISKLTARFQIKPFLSFNRRYCSSRANCRSLTIR